MSALLRILMQADAWNVTVCPLLSFSLAFIVSYRRLLVLSYYVITYNYLLHVRCVGLVVSTCQVIG